MCFVGLPHWKGMVCSSTTVGLMRSMTSLLWRYWTDKWFLNTPQVNKSEFVCSESLNKSWTNLWFYNVMCNSDNSVYVVVYILSL